MNKKRVGLNVPPGIIGACALLMAFILAVPAQEPRLFRVEDFTGSLVLQYERTHEIEKYLGAVQRDLFRNFLEGGIKFDTSGSIYHPNFLSFEANVNILAHRTKDIFFTDSSINNDINNTYDIRLNFLKKKKLNFQFYAVRYYFSFDRAFYERYFTILKNIGASVNSKAKLFPFMLDVYVSRAKSESLTFSERDERSKNLDFKVDLLNVKRTNSKLTFKFKDYSESLYDIEFQSMDLMANFQHYFGGKRSGGSDSVISILDFRRLRGDSDFSTINLYNSARYHLKRNLYVGGEYRLVKDNSFNRSSTQQNISTRLHHKLYESLDTTLMVGGRSENSNYQEVNALRYGITFNYQKRIPTGVFRLIFANQRENASYQTKSAVFNTTYRLDFAISDTIVIARVGINADSIVVTDPNYMHIYVPGVDYIVAVVHNTVTITRLPGGAIPPDALALLHFEFITTPDFKLKLNTYRLEAHLQVLKLFHFYYRQAVNDPVIVSDYTVFPFEDYNRKGVGGKFNTRFLRAGYYRETYNSSLSNYISYNYRLAINIRIGRFFKMSGDVMVNRLNYRPEAYFSHLDAYTAECSVFPSSRLVLRGIYRKIKYTVPGLLREQESIIVKAHYTFRRIIVEFFYEHIFYGALDSERKRDYLSLIIRRTF
jgi:hypothetical protein